MTVGLPGPTVARRLLLGAILACGAGPVAGAQDLPDAHGAATGDAVDALVSAGTGDAWSDRQLHDIDLYAARHRDAFVDELVRYFDAPRAFVEGVLAQPGWRAGELYYACAVARVAGRPCRAVAELRARARQAPWESLAAQVGIEPGSAQAARLGESFAASYRRWARPLPPKAAPAPDGSR
ncbi:MAG TPA: hypothetical protein VLK29_11070 [Luteimonas sp.]|nr:hypothetical protein [Luteimonas sp.]